VDSVTAGAFTLDELVGTIPFGGTLYYAAQGRWREAGGSALFDLLTLGAARLAAAPAGSGVSPYQVGRFDDLERASRVGDDLALHHEGQKHAMKQVVPGYDPHTAPAIALPTGEHLLLPTIRGPYTGTARDLLARGIHNLRQFTNAPGSALLDLINLNKSLYPGSFKR
jgi:hypothetical protein